MSRPHILAANWKMNLSLPEAISFIPNLENALDSANLSGKEILIFPPSCHITPLLQEVENSGLPIEIGAQNCHEKDKGAYTGELSAGIIKSTGANHVVLGHSERREFYGETDFLVADKIDMAYHYGLKPIYCCGENLEDREGKRQYEVVENQIKEALFDLDNEVLNSIIVAYEPVWAIGTGKTAAPEEAQEMHSFIRQCLKKQIGSKSQNIPILYGGSVKPNNAESLFNCDDVDGGLIGGASLNPEEFAQIIQINPE